MTNTVYTRPHYEYYNRLDDDGSVADNDGDQSEVEDEQASKEADIFADDLVRR